MMNKRAFLLIVAALLGAHTESIAAPKYLNEWLFDLDAPGLTLSAATNSGTDGAAFSPDTNLVTRTDGLQYLICSNNVPGTGNLWSDGAVLNAAVTSPASGVCFLRYDVRYDMTATNNDSGTLLGLGFTDAGGDHLSMFALEYASSSKVLSAGITQTEVATSLPLQGTISVIARVDVGSRAIDVWYDLSGENNFGDINFPDKTADINHLTSIDQLQFRATGDFIASPADCARIDNIRMAATWNEITNSVLKLNLVPELGVSIFDSLGGSMLASETNTIMVTVTNSADPATAVYTKLTHDAGAGLSIVSSSNAPAPLASGGLITNTYKVVANKAGSYNLQAQAFSAEITNSPVLFNLLVRPGQEPSTNALTITVAPGETASATFSLVNHINSSASYRFSDDSPWVSYSVVTIGDFVRTVAVHRVTYTPEIGTLGAQAVQNVTIHVDASEQGPGTTNFTTTITWGDGSTGDIDVTVIVAASSPALTVTPAAIDFEGPAGFVSKTNMFVINTGNVALDYQITDVGAMNNGYAWTNAPYAWESVSMSDFSAAHTFPVGTDTGTTPWIPVGFSFPFYGNVYTQLTISIDGEIRFGDGQKIVGPYRGDLIFDGNSAISYAGDANRMAIAWNHLSQKNGAEDLTFEAILYKNGTILFQYKLLSDADRWPATPIGLQSGSLMTQASLVDGGAGDFQTVSFTTNYTVVTNGWISTIYTVVTNGWNGDFPILSTNETVVTNSWTGDFPILSTNATNVVATYVETVGDLAIRFYPSSPVVITVDPASGRLAPGETRQITVIGNATTLNTGGGNSVTADTLFSVSTQPPILVNLVSATDEFDWQDTSVFGLFQLRKKVGESFVAPFPSKPRTVYTGGIISQEQPYAPELGSGFLPLGNKWSWGPSTVGAWDTIYIRMPWVNDSLKDPDNRDDGFVQAEPSVSVDVHFTATGSADPAYPLMSADADADGVADLLEWTAGTDANSADSIFAVNSRQNPGGFRTLSWPAPNDSLSRTYTIWYTTSLNGPWHPIVQSDNITSYVDDDPARNAEPAVFYKVSVLVQ